MTKFLTPSEVPEEVVCRTIKVPNSLEWLGIFNAVLLAGTYYYNWSDDIDTHMTREEAAAAYTVIFNEYLTAAMECDVCTLPSGGAAIRQNGFGRFQMLDDGAWGEPTGDYALPPLNARTEPTDDEKRCLGAANAANVYEQLYEALADEYADNHDEALFFLAIGVIIAGLFLPPLGVLAASFLEVATILVAEGFGAFAFLTADVWDSEFTEEFKCLLYNRASVDGSGVVTFDFPAVVNDVASTMALSFDDPTLQKARLALQLGTILQYAGADGLNYAGSTTAITEADCGCGVWCKRWYLSEGSHEGMTVTLDAGTYVVDGVQGVASGGSSLLRVIMVFDMDTEIDTVSVGYSTATTSGFGTRQFQVHIDGGSPIRVEPLSPSAGINMVGVMDGIGLNINQVNCIIDTAGSTTPNFLHWIQISGQGACPFDDCDDCE